MEWIDWLLHGGRHLMAALTLATALLASAHAAMRKRDSRAAVLWIVIAWTLPLAGPLLYVLVGINRIKRQAALLRGDLEHFYARPGSPSSRRIRCAIFIFGSKAPWQPTCRRSSWTTGSSPRGRLCVEKNGSRRWRRPGR